MVTVPDTVEIAVGPQGLQGLFGVPEDPAGLVIFAHGSGSLDGQVIELNRMAHDRLRAPKELVIVEGAGHLFEEPGTLDAVQQHAARWFRHYLAGEGGA